MASLSLPSFSTLAGFATNKPLGDPSLPSSPATLGLPALSTTSDIKDPLDSTVTLGSITVAQSASASVAVVNSKSDPDPIGFFNLGSTDQPAAEDPAAAPDFKAPVAFDTDAAYVVISGLSVTGKIAGTFTIGAAGALGCFSALQAGTGDFRSVLPECVSDFSGLAAQSYGSRIFASMLVLAGMLNPQGLDKLSRSIQLTWKDGAGTRTVVVRQGKL